MAPTEPQTVPTRILLAEDDQAMRQLLAETLAGQGYAVEEADNGAALTNLVEDLVLALLELVATAATIRYHRDS